MSRFLFSGKNYFVEKICSKGAFMKRICCFVLIIFLTMSYAKEEKKSKVKIEGIAEIGVDFTHVEDDIPAINYPLEDSDIKKLGRVELGMIVKPIDPVKLEFDIIYDHRFHNVNVNKLFGQYSFSSSDVRFGYMKKSFGIEEMTGRGKRQFYSRSIINDALESYNLLGHDLSVQYRHSFNHSRLITSFSADGTFRRFGLLTGEWDIKKWKYVASFLFADCSDAPESTYVFTANLGTKYTGKHVVNELEVCIGTNPELRVLELFRGNDTHPLFGGIRAQQSFPIHIGRKILNTLIPLWEVTAFTERLDKDGMSLQVRPGINCLFTKKDILQWYTSLDIRFSSENQYDKSLSMISRGITSEVRILW